MTDRRKWVGGFFGMVGMGEWGPPTPLTDKMVRSEYYDAEGGTYWGCPIYETEEVAIRALFSTLSEETLETYRVSLAGFRELEERFREIQRAADA